jgi:hypothetical protein
MLQAEVSTPSEVKNLWCLHFFYIWRPPNTEVVFAKEGMFSVYTCDMLSLFNVACKLICSVSIFMFLLHVQLIVPVHSSLADMARQMLRDCIYDLQEIRQCRDCYRVSNEKSDKHWFCQPCRPPHQLVYAKQKGFPYWPAKVRLLCFLLLSISKFHSSSFLAINST